MRVSKSFRLYEKLLSTEKLHKCMIYAPVVSTNHPKAFFRPIAGKNFLEGLYDCRGNIPRSLIDEDNWKFLCREVSSGSPVEIAAPRVANVDGKIHAIGYFDPENDRIAVFHTIRRQFHTIPPIDGSYWRQKVERAHQQRIDVGLLYSGNSAYRLIHGAADGIPGLLVDVFGNSCHIKIRHDGPLLGALHAVYAFLCVRGVEKLWIEYAKHNRHAFFGNEFLNPVFHENGVQMCIRQTVKNSTQDIFHFDNRLRAVRALLQTMSQDRHALDIFSGEGFAAMALLHGSPRSVMALESRPEKRMQLRRIEGLSNSDTLEFPEFERMSTYVAELDSEGFQLVHCSIPDNLKEAIARDDKEVSEEKFLSKLIYHGMRCCAPNGYFVVSGACLMIPAHELGINVLELIQRASVKLLRPVKQLRYIQPGPDIPTTSFRCSGLEKESTPSAVGYVFKLD
ncbi:Fmu (Sun) domain-containing protein [Perkinsela sp. CCAP 1560/4]|nr:Fmu (Sun) domain-containing protein [Perkinsela sp. CCAP 1560/4]|eukprot:KNH03744.1 Fmu (Sun) domain-containing protein [Perkinsela sp. CCAP 1560/4]